MNNVGAKRFNLYCVKNTAPEISHHFSLSKTKKKKKNSFHLNIQIIVVKENAFLFLFFLPNKNVKFTLLCEEIYKLSLVSCSHTCFILL